MKIIKSRKHKVNEDKASELLCSLLSSNSYDPIETAENKLKEINNRKHTEKKEVRRRRIQKFKNFFGFH